MDVDNLWTGRCMVFAANIYFGGNNYNVGIIRALNG